MALPWAAVTTVPIWYFTSVVKYVLSTDSPQERDESQITVDFPFSHTWIFLLSFYFEPASVWAPVWLGAAGLGSSPADRQADRQLLPDPAVPGAVVLTLPHLPAPYLPCSAGWDSSERLHPSGTWAMLVGWRWDVRWGHLLCLVWLAGEQLLPLL